MSLWFSAHKHMGNCEIIHGQTRFRDASVMKNKFLGDIVHCNNPQVFKLNDTVFRVDLPVTMISSLYYIMWPRWLICVISDTAGLYMTQPRGHENNMSVPDDSNTVQELVQIWAKLFILSRTWARQKSAMYLVTDFFYSRLCPEWWSFPSAIWIVNTAITDT